MFKPILHNLDKTCDAFNAVQAYNKIISNKNLQGFTLEEKLKSEKIWLHACKKALEEVKEILNKEGNKWKNL